MPHTNRVVAGALALSLLALLLQVAMGAPTVSGNETQSRSPATLPPRVDGAANADREKARKAAASKAKNDSKTTKEDAKAKRPAKAQRPAQTKRPAKAKRSKTKRDKERATKSGAKRGDKDRRKSAVKRKNDKKPAAAARRPPPPLPVPTYTPLERSLKESLSLEVVDLGPYERWEVNIRNRSDEERRVAVDSRLLSFEAVVPGKRQPVECSLPSSMLPTRRQTRYVYLSPGETRTFQVDPRMYCFETGDQSILVPGTFLRPRYGWSEKTKVRWSWGRRYEERLTQAPPFVAMLPDAARIGPPPQVDERSASGAATEDATDVDADQGLKQLEGEGFALRSDYKGWARTRLPKDDLGDRPGKDLKLAITYGSDAPNPRDITVRVELENQSNEAQRVYFRSDLVSFLVRGPDGTTECEAIAAERRAPDPQAFTTIGAGKRASFTIRLLEFCPAESFARPGFYYVSAVLPATARGALADEDMFTGRLATSAPRPVRLHRAELPFLIKRRNDAVSRAGGPSNARVGGGRTNAPQQTNTQPAAPVQAPAQPTPTPATAPPPPPNPPPTPPPIPPPAPVR